MKLTQEISNITSHHITVMLLFGTKWNRIDVVRKLISLSFTFRFANYRFTNVKPKKTKKM